ncbi:MAG: DUF2892 domain-containing protein [Ignavibacteriae bacterium]|nr:DUF2892 domain-containing protein [Ignavibacteriota bacterium]
MQKNVGGIDKNIRFILGVSIIIIGYLNNTWLGAIGIVPIFTALIGWCPFYVPLKLSTLSKKEKN